MNMHKLILSLLLALPLCAMGARGGIAPAGDLGDEVVAKV